MLGGYFLSLRLALEIERRLLLGYLQLVPIAWIGLEVVGHMSSDSHDCPPLLLKLIGTSFPPFPAVESLTPNFKLLILANGREVWGNWLALAGTGQVA